MNWHWRASVALNTALCGDRSEPLCSRVYRQPDSLWRSVYLFTADLLFAEYQHCRNIHARWHCRATR